MECDMFFCDSEYNVQPLNKYINVCELCWFNIMNGVKKLNDREKAHFIMLEEKRKNEA